VADLLREVTSYAASVFVPPNFDRRYTEVFGSTIEDVFETGLISLDQKLKAAGLPPEELPGPPPIPYNLTPRERADHAVGLLKAGILGEKNGPPARDEATMRLLFDMVEHSVDTSQTPDGGMTIQWDFKDADPWHLRVDNGSTKAESGRLEEADLVLRCRFEDWADITAGRTDPRLALATGKLRPKGGIKQLLRMQKLFG
jgi:putative sterol carrier protein